MKSIHNYKGPLIAILTAWVFIFMCFNPPMGMGAQAGNAVVTVRSYNSITGKDIFLKDIADIKGSENMQRKLWEVKIGSSPLPGKNKKIPGSMIESRVNELFPRENGLLNLSIPKIVVVERASQEIPETELKALFYSHIEKKVQGKPFRLRDVKIKGNRHIPLGPRQLVVDERRQMKSSGRMSITVFAKVQGEKSATLHVSGWVDLFDQVVCAERDIPRGGLIRKEDIRLSEKNLSKSPPGLMRFSDDVAGTVARSRIEKGSYIRDAMIAKAPLIRKGDMVKIVAKSGTLTVVAQGVSKGEGRMGEQILVENTRSSKNVNGRVVGPGTVEVVF